MPGDLSPEGLIAEIVEAVRAGDDARIRELLRLLADVADVPMLFALRDALAPARWSEQVVSSLPRTGRG